MQFNMISCKNGHSFDPRQGRECPYCHMHVQDDKRTYALEKTQEELEEELTWFEIAPVCGWLACIKGPQLGQSFVLHSGKNFIGRDEEIAIIDSGVAVRNHAAIAYDEKNREFMLLPGDSDGIVYLKGQGVFHATRMSDMDRITVGQTELLFRPLCGEHFAWDVDNTPNFGTSMAML